MEIVNERAVDNDFEWSGRLVMRQTGKTGISLLKNSLMIILLLLVGGNSLQTLHAQPAEEKLDQRQKSIALRFQRFEKMLLQMAQYMRKTDPEKAELLVRAIGQSKQDRIGGQMEQIVLLLEQQQLGDALDQQEQLVTVMQKLFDLLQSEDRLTELEQEKKRLQEILKDLKKVAAREKNLRIATERGNNLERLADKQKQIAEQNQKLADKIKKQDDARNNEQSDKQNKGENKTSEKKPAEKKPTGEKPNETKPSEQKPSEGQQSESQKSQGEKSEGQKSQGQQSQGQQSQGQPSQNQQDQQQQTPGREQIEQAQKKLQQAIEELQKKQKENATKEQDEALAELLKAKAKLEERLRQLREEEMELVLAALEARFRKMLNMQVLVNTGTTNLAKVPNDKWTSRHFGQVRKLVQDEEAVILEASKALNILKEEGSAVAFPEALEQLLEDMQTVARFLQEENVGELTQAIEQDIVAALQEMIEALQQEMEKQSQKKQKKKGGGQGSPQDQGLVDQIAELKMLKTLQVRIYSRTKQIGRMIVGEQAEEQELLKQLDTLSSRQQRVQEAAYNIATKRNQ